MASINLIHLLIILKTTNNDFASPPVIEPTFLADMEALFGKVAKLCNVDPEFKLAARHLNLNLSLE